MNDRSNLPLFHFLFCQLIQQCYLNYKQDHYLQHLKKAGKDIGYKMYNYICIKKQINQRPSSILALIKNIQTKVFKFLFNYQAYNIYTANSEENVVPKQYYHVIEDNVSVYLTWMPEHLYDTATLFAGIIQSICECSGLVCQVRSYYKVQNNMQNPLTQYQVKISQEEIIRWKENQ